MKKIAFSLIVFSFIAFSSVTTMSCNRRAGCPAQENITAKTNRKGELKNKRGKQHLFSKKMRRKK